MFPLLVMVCGKFIMFQKGSHCSFYCRFPLKHYLIALGGDDIKRHLESIMPFMRKRGGYIPTCDHGVPEEVSFENYMLYRKLMKEYCD